VDNSGDMFLLLTKTSCFFVIYQLAIFCTPPILLIYSMLYTAFVSRDLTISSNS
jgi:hypothetical protein